MQPEQLTDHRSNEAFNPPESDVVRDSRTTDAAAKSSLRFIDARLSSNKAYSFIRGRIVFEPRENTIFGGNCRNCRQRVTSIEMNLLRELNEQSVPAVAWDRLALKRRRSRRISMRTTATTTDDRKRPFISSIPIQFCELKFWSSCGHQR